MSKTWTYLLGSFVALSVGSTFVVAHEMDWLGTKTTTSSAGSSINWSSGTDYSNQFDVIKNIYNMPLENLQNNFQTLSTLNEETIKMLSQPANVKILKTILLDQQKMTIIIKGLAEAQTHGESNKLKLEKLLDPYLLKAISTSNLENIDQLKSLIAIASVLKLGHESLDKLKKYNFLPWPSS